MAAPKGNKFWLNRSKHGRDKIFSSPQILWEEACKYFEYCVENPLMVTEAKVVSNGAGEGSSVEMIEIPKARAFTWAGLEFFLGVGQLRHYKTNPDYKDFLQVIIEIENVMYSQKFEGAASGIFNANIIARDLGLSDKQDITTGGEKLSSKLNDLSFDELMTLAHGHKGTDNTRGKKGTGKA
jgi:hypothetical protein